MSRSDGFAASYLALLAALWAEFETVLSALSAGPDDARRSRAEGRTQILRLELILLRDACEGPRLRALLGPERRFRVRVLIDDLRWLLDLPGPAAATARLGAALERAQNRLYDEARHLALEVGNAQLRAG